MMSKQLSGSGVVSTFGHTEADSSKIPSRVLKKRLNIAETENRFSKSNLDTMKAVKCTGGRIQIL